LGYQVEHPKHNQAEAIGTENVCRTHPQVYESRRRAGLLGEVRSSTHQSNARFASWHSVASVTSGDLVLAKSAYEEQQRGTEARVHRRVFSAYVGNGAGSCLLAEVPARLLVLASVASPPLGSMTSLTVLCMAAVSELSIGYTASIRVVVRVHVSHLRFELLMQLLQFIHVCLLRRPPYSEPFAFIRLGNHVEVNLLCLVSIRSERQVRSVQRHFSTSKRT
jgi:hypothetical protein